MSVNFDSGTSKIIIYTGNILNLSEIKKKVGQTLTEEVLDCIRIVLAQWKSCSEDVPKTETVEIKSCNGGLDVKEERKDLKFGLKMFLPVRDSGDKSVISSALDLMVKELATTYVESLVLSQAGRQAEGIEPEQQLSRMDTLWKQTEAEIQKGRVLSAGISNIDTDLFVTLHQNAKEKPSIVQINLATCCVVPPALQTFAKEHNVQLLTHNDPTDLLPDATIAEIFGAGWRVGWVLRSQVHVKCRGVLASKGYIILLERE